MIVLVSDGVSIIMPCCAGVESVDGVVVIVARWSVSGACDPDDTNQMRMGFDDRHDIW